MSAGFSQKTRCVKLLEVLGLSQKRALIGKTKISKRSNYSNLGSIWIVSIALSNPFLLISHKTFFTCNLIKTCAISYVTFLILKIDSN